MSIKNELRKELKQKRRNILDKVSKDSKISAFLETLESFKNADLILFYSALCDEVNIDNSIEYALKIGKKAALPVCIDKNGSMKYYYINSFDDVLTGSFNIREPDVNKCKEVINFTNSLCVVPAISFDKKGYRLGYGKGYYDRFLQNFSSLSVGLCYNELIVDELPVDKYDVSVDYIISENGVYAV